MTEITTMSTITPSITPTIEISVMMETKVRFGFRYRSARKKLNGSFKVAEASSARTRSVQAERLASHSCFYGVRFEIFEVHELEDGGMRRLEIDGRGAATLQRRFPTRDADAPAITRF